MSTEQKLRALGPLHDALVALLDGDDLVETYVGQRPSVAMRVRQALTAMLPAMVHAEILAALGEQLAAALAERDQAAAELKAELATLQARLDRLPQPATLKDVIEGKGDGYLPASLAQLAIRKFARGGVE